MVNHFEFHTELTNKRKMYNNLLHFCNKYKIDCFDFVPLTIIINNRKDSLEFNFQSFSDIFNGLENLKNNKNNNRPSIVMKKDKGLYFKVKYLEDNYYNYSNLFIVNVLEKEFFENLTVYIPETHFFEKNLWIVKPTDLCQGKCLEVLDDLKKIFKKIKQFFNGLEIASLEEESIFAKASNENDKNSNQDKKEAQDEQVSKQTPSEIPNQEGNMNDIINTQQSSPTINPAKKSLSNLNNINNKMANSENKNEEKKTFDAFLKKLTQLCQYKSEIKEKNDEKEQDEYNQNEIKKEDNNTQQNNKNKSEGNQEDIIAPNKDSKETEEESIKNAEEAKKEINNDIKKDSRAKSIPKVSNKDNKDKLIKNIDNNKPINNGPSADTKATNKKKYFSNCIIIQKYIENPFLYKNRKFDIRVWVLINHENEVFMFKEGHIKTSSHEYNINSKNSFIHITNYSLQKYSSEFSKFELGNEASYSDLNVNLHNSNNF